MIIGMNKRVIAFYAAKNFDGTVGNDFIHIHVGTGAGASLNGIGNKFFA